MLCSLICSSSRFQIGLEIILKETSYFYGPDFWEDILNNSKWNWIWKAREWDTWLLVCDVFWQKTTLSLSTAKSDMFLPCSSVDHGLSRADEKEQSSWREVFGASFMPSPFYLFPITTSYLGRSCSKEFEITLAKKEEAKCGDLNCFPLQQQDTNNHRIHGDGSKKRWIVWKLWTQWLWPSFEDVNKTKKDSRQAERSNSWQDTEKETKNQLERIQGPIPNPEKENQCHHHHSCKLSSKKSFHTRIFQPLWKWRWIRKGERKSFKHWRGASEYWRKGEFNGG